MTLNEKCWVKNTCKKYLENKDCDCCHQTDDLDCIRLYKLTNLYNNALLSETQRYDTPLYGDGIDDKQYEKLSIIKKNIVNHVNNGDNFYIHSITCGTGKTMWSLKLLRNYLNKIWVDSPLKCRALFINVPRFLLALKDSISNVNEYANHIKDNVMNADLVIWDEIGTKNISEFEAENLLSIINARIDSGKSNIYTSNLSPQDMREKLGERLYSRIVNYSEEIEFKGADKRGLIR